MPESAEEVYARVLASVSQDGRLATPPVAEWDTFPWEGVTGPRRLLPPVEAEPARQGAGGARCWRCENPDELVIWRNDSWLVSTPQRPSGLPLVVFLMTREHLDFTDLDDEMAGEFGRLTVWLTRIIERLPNIGRTHVCKWGDGSEHMHCWFMARTARLSQTVGSYAAEWDEILPDVPREVWCADLAHVAARLATHDGEAVGLAARSNHDVD
jgi:hypothetical protein